MTSELPFFCRLRIFDEIAQNAQKDYFLRFFDEKTTIFWKFFIEIF